jgi:hypothetical protein
MALLRLNPGACVSLMREGCAASCSLLHVFVQYKFPLFLLMIWLERIKRHILHVAHKLDQEWKSLEGRGK